MTLINTLRTDLTAAMKAKDELARTTLRSAIAAIEAKAKEGKEVVELSGADEIRVLIAGVKTRRATAEGFAKIPTDDAAQRAARELAEADILAAYLPPAPTEGELHALVAEAVRETGAESIRDMGRVVNIVKDAAPTADGKQVSDFVKAALLG